MRAVAMALLGRRALGPLAALASMTLACGPPAAVLDASSSEDDAASHDAASHDSARDRDALDASDAGPFAVLVFTRTTGFRHESIEPALAALEGVASARSLDLEHTEDPARLADLSEDDVVVFLSTTGDVLGPVEELELERFVRAGGGWVGVHSASDTEYDWPFYGELVGAYFDGHPAVQPAQIHVEDSSHATVAHLADPWTHVDEYYDFRESPRGAVSVLLTVDETTYEGGTMGADHPIAWHHTIDRGRAFYTALGHPSEAWADPALVDHVAAAITWAAAR